jgi:hypothetical protein
MQKNDAERIVAKRRIRKLEEGRVRNMEERKEEAKIYTILDFALSKGKNLKTTLS